MDAEPVIEQPPTWDGRCPKCGAEVQEVARRCWNCGADIPARGFDESEYRPSALDGDSVEGLSVSFIVVLAFAIPLLVIGWLAYSLLSSVLQFWF